MAIRNISLKIKVQTLPGRYGKNVEVSPVLYVVCYMLVLPSHLWLSLGTAKG